MRAWQGVIFYTVLFSIIGLGMLLGLSGCPMTAEGVETNMVSMTATNRFEPADAAAPAGTTITWTNDDTKAHTVTIDPGNMASGGPNSDVLFPTGIPAGQQYTWTIPANAPAGTVWYYHCRFHGAPGDGRHRGTGMAGSIIVQ